MKQAKIDTSRRQRFTVKKAGAGKSRRTRKSTLSEELTEGMLYISKHGVAFYAVVDGHSSGETYYKLTYPPQPDSWRKPDSTGRVWEYPKYWTGSEVSFTRSMLDGSRPATAAEIVELKNLHEELVASSPDI